MSKAATGGPGAAARRQSASGPRRGSGNLVSAARRRSGDSMADYDRLPDAARAWAASAVLPWSSRSIARIWARAAAGPAGPAGALAALARAERSSIARDCAAVWGRDHPQALSAKDRPARGAEACLADG